MSHQYCVMNSEFGSRNWLLDKLVIVPSLYGCWLHVLHKQLGIMVTWMHA